jgi:DNA-directed RNA polymerase subunit RPC12/RpoP
MIHHFVCAHVAPEKDFKKEEHLECPKCDKHLRHIGIDYDKPSTIYSCNSCSHEFQNPGMLSLCLDCGTENKLEELLQKTIGNYALTQIGEQFLFKGNGEQALNRNSHVESLSSLNINLFKLLLDQEIKRVKATNGNSFFASIKFQNSQLQLLNKTAKKGLMKEIGGIIKSYLKDTDILSSESFNRYYLLLPETNKSQLGRLENIDYNLSKLLSDNLVEEQQKIDITIHQIKGEDLLQNYFS